MAIPADAPAERLDVELYPVVDGTLLLALAFDFCKSGLFH